VNLEAVLGALLMLRPALKPRVALTDARAIAIASGNEDDAAALVVTAVRETDGRLGCVEGIGGRGTFGLGYGYFEHACDVPKIQALSALQALYDKGWPWHPRKAFLGYVGGHDETKNEEAQTRFVLWLHVRENVKCACCWSMPEKSQWER
jgi:hypothetical protein